MEELRGYLAQVLAETWPWFHFADIAQSGTPMLFGADWALYRGGALFREGDGFEMGELRADAIGVRRFGDFVWRPLSVEKLAAAELPDTLQGVKALIERAAPEDFRLAFARWPRAEDRERFELSLRRAVSSLRTGDFAGLGLDLASPSWRQWLWE